MLLTHWEDAGVRRDNERIPGKKNVFTFNNGIQYEENLPI